MTLNKNYWEERYQQQQLGWDIGHVSPPLKAYIDQLADKDLKILIPGAGYGYEAIYLFEKGFRNTHVLDIAKRPLEDIKKNCPEFPQDQLIEQDFFTADLENFDLVIEQTFFCALDPDLRPSYVQRMHQILKAGGKLAGLFFDFPLTDQGPPYGGSLKEYCELFDPIFQIKILERAYNSLDPRQGSELFFIFEK